MYNEVDFWRKRAVNYGSANTTPNLGISEDEKNLLLSVIKEGFRVFDHGVGEGRLFPLYKQFNCKVVGFDIAEYPALKPNLEKSGLKDDFTYILNDSPTPVFDYKDDSFDLMISLSVLHHVKPENIQRVVWEITRLAPVSIISSYCGDPLQITEDSYMFNHDYTRLFVNSELRVIQFKQIGATGMWILEKSRG
jgi:2-polyprenyl-3-methyl-5-hydroxy-6-metoxy-1,4-benzoquinol methylase